MEEHVEKLTVARLIEALTAARAAALEAAQRTEGDGGTCNFDRCVFTVDGLGTVDVRSALAAATVVADRETRPKHKTRWHLQPPAWGQADRRTAQAEAMAKVLDAVEGVSAYVHYQID